MTAPDPDLGRRMMEEGLLRQDEVVNGLRAAPAPGPLPSRFGRYEVLRLLGKGASGEVYLARDPSIGREVAVKVLTNQSAGERFDREARILGSLTHPHIVAVHDTGVENGRPYFVMERVEGRSLQETLKEGALPLRDRVTVLRDVALACQYAHDRGVVHRDLKPANILLDARGRPFVTDFGIAKFLDAEDRMTLTGTTIGTPWYMSPEQAEGKVREVDPRSDVFSLGVILYEMLAGRVPFQGETFFHVARAVIHDEPAFPRRLSPSAPAELEAVALKAIEKPPGRRYPSARKFADDLTAWLEGRAVSARPPSGALRLARWFQRRPGVTTLGAAALLAAVGVGLFRAHLARAAEEARVEREIEEELGRIVAWDVELYKPPRQIGYGELARSIERLEKIVRAGGRLPAAHYGIARARIRMGRGDEALAELDLALLHAAPKDAGLYHFERARVVWETLLRETIGRNPRAVERLAVGVRDDLHAALARGLEDPWSRDFAQALLGALDGSDAASLERTIQACVRLRGAKEKPAEEAWKLLGDLHLMSRQPDRAIEAYREALKIRQCYVQAKTGLAMAHLARFGRGSDEEGRLEADRVLRHAEEAVEMNAAYGETYHLFALACRSALQRRPDQWAWGGEEFLRRCRQGVEVFERGRAARPDFPPLETALGIIRVFEGAALVLAKQSPEPAIAEAVRAFGVVARVEPGLPDGHVGLGLAHVARATWLRETGQDAGEPLERAAGSLGQALALDPRSAEAHRWMGYVHFLGRRPGEAQASWRKAIEADPGYREELERMIGGARPR